jgi:hypothetical protein
MYDLLMEVSNCFFTFCGESPFSEPGGVGRASRRAAGFYLKKLIMLFHSASFLVVIFVLS